MYRYLSKASSACAVSHISREELECLPTELCNVLITFVTNGLSRHNSSLLCSLRV